LLDADAGSLSFFVNGIFQVTRMGCGRREVSGAMVADRESASGGGGEGEGEGEGEGGGFILPRNG